MLARLRARLPNNAALLGLAFGLALQLSVAGIVSAFYDGGMSDRSSPPTLASPG